LFAAPPPELRPALAAAGFQMDEVTLARLGVLAREAEDLAHLKAAVEVPEARAAVARQLLKPREEVNLPDVLRWVVQGADRAATLQQIISRQPLTATLTAERLTALAAQFGRQGELQRLAGAVAPDRAGGLFALSTEGRWLIGVSFILCAVGVTNAMFMSVTERFTEIATMKCLGALDGFIMQLFVYEAMLQGFLGGLIGAVLGLLLALLRGGWEFGGLMWGALSPGGLALGCLLALIAGVVVAVLAATGPAWVAARLSPMEAMRVE
jgi:hypothetical protein